VFGTNCTKRERVEEEEDTVYTHPGRQVMDSIIPLRQEHAGSRLETFTTDKCLRYLSAPHIQSEAIGSQKSAQLASVVIRDVHNELYSLLVYILVSFLYSLAHMVSS
jgi:hypothetical protein